jgi:hypothetical protein
MRIISCLLLSITFALAACGGGNKQSSTAPTGGGDSAPPPSCQGHMANGQCYPDFASACAAIACEAPRECISLESMPPQTECRDAAK